MVNISFSIKVHMYNISCNVASHKKHSGSVWGYIILICIDIAIGKYIDYIEHTKYGTVIILNGPSVAGKSSIQKAFQHTMMPHLWAKVGIDSLFDGAFPEITPENISYWQSENLMRWIETTHDEKNNNIITLFTGHEGDTIAYAMNSAIAAYAKEGCNVIVDYIAYKQEWVDDLTKKLKNIKVIWVKVDISLATLEQREIARGTSPSGHARSHYNTVHWNI